jgi:hypothetical protein
MLVIHPKNALDQARLTKRFFQDRLPKKKMHLSGVSILSNLLIIIHPLRGPDVLVDQRQARNLPSRARLCVQCCHMPYHATTPGPHAPCTVPYARTPSPHTLVKAQGSALIPFVTPHSSRTNSNYFWQPSRIIDHPYRPIQVFCVHFVLTHAHPRRLLGRSSIPRLLWDKHA